MELLGLCVQGAVGRICKVTICSANPAQPNHSRESSGCSCCLHRERQDMVSQRQIISGTLIQPGDVPAYNQVLNRWCLTFPFPVLAALLPRVWRQHFMAACFLITTGCQMSKPELPSLSLIILADILVKCQSQKLPSLVVFVMSQWDHCLPSA